MDWSINHNGTSTYQQPINSNTLPNKYHGMVRVLPTSVSLQSQKPVGLNGYNGSETRNFTQSNFNVQFTPTMTGTFQTSDVPRIRPPPPSPRANVQQRKGRDEKNKAALHKSMFDLRDVGQDNFQRPPQPQPLAQTLMTSTPKPGYPCYDRHSLNLSYQDLRDVGSASVIPQQAQVPQQSMFSQFQNTQHNQQNRFSLNTGAIDNRAFPTVITPKQSEYQYFKPQLPPTLPTMQYTQPPNVPAVKTQNDDMKSLHDDMAQLRLELASMKDFMREEEEFQTRQVRELEQLRKQWHESSKLIEQKPKKEKELHSESRPTFTSLPPITSSPTPQATLSPPKSPKPTLMVKPTASPKASRHQDFGSMKNPIKELEERFKIQTKQEETPNQKSQQTIEPKKLPPSKLSFIAPVSPKTTYHTSPKSPKPVTSPKPLASPSNQLRRSYSVTPTNPSPFNKPTKPNQIVFPKTGPLFPPAKPELPNQMHGDKNNNYPILPSNSLSDETKSKPITSSNVKVKRISQMFEGNLNEINDKSPQQKSSPHYDQKMGGGTTKKLSPALLQSIRASENTKQCGIQSTYRQINKSPNLKFNSEVSKLGITETNIPTESLDSHRVPPIPKNSSVLSQVPSGSTKPSVLLSSPSLKPPLPSIEPPSPVNNLQAKNVFPVSLTPVLPPSPPPAAFKPSATIYEPPLPVNQEEINSPHHSQIPFPDVNMSDHLPFSLTCTPESPQSTLPHRYSNIPESQYDYQENSQVTSNKLFTSSTSEVTSQKPRYENVPDSEQQQIHDTVDSVPDYSPPLPPKDFLPDQSSSEDFTPGEQATPRTVETQHPHPMTSFLTVNSQPDNISGTTPSSSSLRKTSIPVIIRPTAAPPPPPPASIPIQTTKQSKPVTQISDSLPIASPNSTPPPPPIPKDNYIPSPPPPPSPQYILENQSPAISQTLHHRRTSSISSIASIPGSPLSPVGTASKSHLLEQIRQFKESGKGLKKSNENEEQVGTPTRVRRNSIQDVLLTRFKAFSGNQSESESSEDEQNNVEDDWED